MEDINPKFASEYMYKLHLKFINKWFYLQG